MPHMCCFSLVCLCVFVAKYMWLCYISKQFVRITAFGIKMLQLFLSCQQNDNCLLMLMPPMRMMMMMMIAMLLLPLPSFASYLSSKVKLGCLPIYVCYILNALRIFGGIGDISLFHVLFFLPMFFARGLLVE